MSGERKHEHETPDVYLEYLHAHHDLPDGWRWYEVSCAETDAPPGMARFVGAVAPIGPRSGRPRWDMEDKSTRRTIFASVDEINAWWEAESAKRGDCPDCHGFGERWSGWSKADGHRYKPCARCGETGRWCPEPTP